MSRFAIFTIILSFVLLGAGCVRNVVIEPIVVPQQETEISPTTYVMSSGDVMLTLPIGWSVRQLDAGGASVVEAYGDDPAAQWTYIVVASPVDFDSGEALSYQAWLDQYELANPVGSREVGGVVMDSFELITESGENELSYTAVLDPDRPLFARVRVPASNIQATQILDSIIFSPTDEQRASAQVIN
jgi:small ligand-binding sensory domain FIST